MNTPNRPAEPALVITELEARFEMEALTVLSGGHPGTDWSCHCMYQF